VFFAFEIYLVNIEFHVFVVLFLIFPCLDQRITQKISTLQSTDVSEEHVASIFSVEEHAKQETRWMLFGLFLALKMEATRCMPKDITLQNHLLESLGSYIPAPIPIATASPSLPRVGLLVLCCPRPSCLLRLWSKEILIREDNQFCVPKFDDWVATSSPLNVRGTHFV
jgi:hypothetical protein